MLDVFGRLLDLPTVESAGRSGFFKSRFFIDSECERCLALFFLATSGLAGSASLNHETYLKTPRLSFSRVPTSGAIFRLCSEAEHIECVGILPFCDEFCEEMGFGIIHEKFGQALA